ncbi:uncharacterized protein [Taeniopygia guttata]|uniref:uncharacterized protein n=1 Tax=Taeniopygia guttata TaxID=59729 RepID=UPI003BB90B9C
MSHRTVTQKPVTTGMVHQNGEYGVGLQTLYNRLRKRLSQPLAQKHLKFRKIFRGVKRALGAAPLERRSLPGPRGAAATSAAATRWRCEPSHGASAACRRHGPARPGPGSASPSRGTPKIRHGGEGARLKNAHRFLCRDVAPGGEGHDGAGWGPGRPARRGRTAAQLPSRSTRGRALLPSSPRSASLPPQCFLRFAAASPDSRAPQAPLEPCRHLSAGAGTAGLPEPGSGHRVLGSSCPGPGARPEQRQTAIAFERGSVLLHRGPQPALTHPR